MTIDIDVNGRVRRVTVERVPDQATRFRVTVDGLSRLVDAVDAGSETWSLILPEEQGAAHRVAFLEATPAGAASTLDRLLILEQLVALLEAGGAEQLDLPVAICLSKIDCLSEERRRAALANPTQALLDHLGPTSLTWFEAVCPTLRCFAVSSAGPVVPDAPADRR